jgi:hypothetical protein
MSSVFVCFEAAFLLWAYDCLNVDSLIFEMNEDGRVWDVHWLVVRGAPI